jgi:hypothetical protein
VNVSSALRMGVVIGAVSDPTSVVLQLVLRVAATGPPRAPRRRLTRDKCFGAEDGWGCPRTGPANRL